jgi:hypothetical protein
MSNEGLDQPLPKSVRLLRASPILGQALLSRWPRPDGGRALVGCLGHSTWQRPRSGRVHPVARERRFVHVLLLYVIETPLG